MWFNFCSSSETGTDLNYFRESTEYHYNSCPEVVMQDAQYFSPLDPLDVTNELFAELDLENLMEIESDFDWTKGGWEEECIDVEMVDLTGASENIMSMSDCGMYEATEKLWSLNLEDSNLPWISSDIYMVDIPQDDHSDYMMSF
ncbi:hypothetical protein PTTG_25226 [Puccinia triticina 1-1 BBBD Race 1]|uniref:Uncharacterized protein n=1 Tax=Puccinia triticina (isolate 1-1 / race 1 (BBBD)) TaxID=630390 RepID=A0A180H3M5_PUCT1|nr:hypothetical protein PTTG_25226 [Puccinia triticina 1-1 BBBD Race 1]